MTLFTRIETPAEYVDRVEKVAAKIPLSDNNRQWSNEILAELYRVHSYLGKYSVNIEVLKEDEPNGYMQAMFVVTNSAGITSTQRGGNFTVKKARPGTPQTASSDDPDNTPDSAPKSAIAGPDPNNQAAAQEPATPDQSKPSMPSEGVLRIPILVEAGKLYTFDICILPDGKLDQLDRSIVEDVFSGTNEYTVSTRDSAAYPYSEGQQMSPDVPNTRTLGNLRMGTTEKVASILDLALQFCSKEKVASRIKEIDQDKTLLKAISIRPELYLSFEKIAKAAKREEAKPEPKRPLSALLEKSASSGFLLHTIDGDTLEVVSTKLSNAQARFLPTEVINKAIDTGECLLGDAYDAEPVTSNIEKVASVATTGVYHLMTPKGKVVENCVVFSDVKRIYDGASSGISLVLGTEGVSYQEKVAGIRNHSLSEKLNPLTVADSASQGYGVFVLPSGEVTEPVNVTTWITKGHEKIACNVTNEWDQSYTLTMDNSIFQPAAISDSEVLFPSEARFVALDSKVSTNLYSKNIEQLEKVAYNSVTDDLVIVEKEGKRYYFSGNPTVGAPVSLVRGVTEKVAKLVLAALGTHPNDASQVLNFDDKDRQTFTTSCRLVQVEKEKVAAKVYDDFDADYFDAWIPKVAAALPTDKSIDTVLALGFVTPESLSVFIDHIPELVETRRKFAALLLAVRMGNLPDIPEAACLSAMKGINKTVRGLQYLSASNRASEQMEMTE